MMAVKEDEMECKYCIWYYNDGSCHFDGKDTPPCMLPEVTKEDLLDEDRVKNQGTKRQ